MKILPTVITGAVLIWTTGPAAGGYSDLKRDMNAYLPPALLQQRNVSAPPATDKTDAFAAETATIESMRDRWEKRVGQRMTTIGQTDIPPAVIEAAADDARTLDLLRPHFSLETTQALIGLRNRSIRGAAQRFRAALEGFDQVTQLDEILRQYSAFTESVMPGVGPMKSPDAIQMRFPFPGLTALKGQVAEKNVAAEKESLDLTQRDTIAQGRKAYWNLLYIHRAQRITRDMLDRLNQLESVATTRYGAGKTSYQDVVKIRISREKLVEQLATLKEQRANLETELLALINLPPGPAVGVPEPLTPGKRVPELASLYPLALQNRQELRRMRAMLGKMDRMVAMGETMIQPSFSQNHSLFTDEAVLQVGSAGMKPTFGTTVSPTRGEGLPKNAWFGIQDAYLRETRRKRDALGDDLVDAEARTQWMVRTAWFDLDLARREWSLYEDRLLALSQTSLEVSTRGYESGGVSFADVISAYTGWLDVNLAGQRRISDVGIARAELERRVGVPLP